MPIQQAEVSVMPRLAAIDTSPILQAANAPINGALQGLQFMQGLGLTKEQLGTLATRIAAANAKNQNTIDTMPGLSAATNAQNLQTTQLAPAETTNKLATLAAALPNIGPAGTLAGLGIQNQTDLANRTLATKTQLDEKARAQAESDTTDAQASEAAANDRADAKVKTAELDSLLADYKTRLAPDQFNLQSIQLQKALADAPDAMARQIALTQGKIDLQKAEAQYYIDHGKFMLGEGRQTGRGAQPVDPEKAVSALDTEIKRMETLPSGSGVKDETGRDETLAQYTSRTRNPDGTMKQVGGQRGLPDALTPSSMMVPVPTSKDAEELLKQKKIIQNHKALYLGKIAQAILDNNDVPQGQQAQQAPSMPQLSGPSSLLQGMGLAPQQATQQSAVQPLATNQSQQAQPIPKGAIQMLRANPKLAPIFEQKYHISAAQFLAQ